jgi:hypothetical protein
MFFAGGITIGHASDLNPTTLGPGSTLTVNGRRIEGPCTVEVRQGVVYVNGSNDEASSASRTVTVHINIDARDVPLLGGIRLNAGTVTVTGNVNGGVRTVSGSVDVKGDVDGGVRTVSGSVNVGGSINDGASSVSGSIRSKGAIHSARSQGRTVITNCAIGDGSVAHVAGGVTYTTRVSSGGPIRRASVKQVHTPLEIDKD